MRPTSSTATRSFTAIALFTPTTKSWRSTTPGCRIRRARAITASTDFYITPNGEAIPAKLDVFNDNLSKLKNEAGKYVGLDSKGPIRVRVNEIHFEDPTFKGTLNPLHSVPHFHIERRIRVNSGKWMETFTGSMGVFYK